MLATEIAIRRRPSEQRIEQRPTYGVQFIDRSRPGSVRKIPHGNHHRKLKIDVLLDHSVSERRWI